MSPSNATILLATILVEVQDSIGNFQTLRALLDCASQANFITDKCIKILGLPRFRADTSIHGLSQMSTQSSSAITCTPRPTRLTQPSFTIEAKVLPKICSHMSVALFSKEKLFHISNLQLADPNFNVPASIDMFLGAKVFPLIIKENNFAGNDTVAIDTHFGHIITGKVHTYSTSSVSSFFTSIDSTLKRFWELEEIPHKIILSPDDTRCKEIYARSYQRDHSGRYTPFVPSRFHFEIWNLPHSQKRTLKHYVDFIL